MNPARHPAKRSAAAKADATATLDPITAYFILPLRQSCGGAKKAARYRAESPRWGERWAEISPPNTNKSARVRISLPDHFFGEHPK
jgi:hypothetical protein